MSTPSPSLMPLFKAPAPPAKPRKPVVLAVNEPADPGKIVRPGLVPTLAEGVIKAKQVKPGMVLRAFLKGEARGGERTVSKVTRSDDGSMVNIEFSSPHPPTDYKAAYRFWVKDLVVHVPALVAYEEV